MGVNNCSLTQALYEITFSLFPLNHLNYDTRPFSYGDVGDLISNLTGDSFMSQGLNRIWEVQGIRCPHRSSCSWAIHRIRGSSQMGLGSLCLSHTKQLFSLRLLHLLRIGRRAVCGCLPHEETMVNTPLPGCASLPLSSLSTLLSL